MPAPVKEEYFENLIQPEEKTSEEKAEEIAKEIFEEIKAEAEVKPEKKETKKAPVKRELSQIKVEEFLCSEEKSEVENDNETPTDKALGELAADAQEGRFDFINLCVLGLIMLFFAMTFIFMRQENMNRTKAELTAETFKTGEYTQQISENYTENLTESKVLTQANVLLRKLFGKSDLEFVTYTDSKLPNGPVDNENLGGSSWGEGGSDAVVTTTGETTSAQEVTTTPKIALDVDLSPPTQAGEEYATTGRPIQTTTEYKKVQTTLDLPRATDETTTGKVNLIFPE